MIVDWLAKCGHSIINLLIVDSYCSSSLTSILADDINGHPHMQRGASYYYSLPFFLKTYMGKKNLH